MLWHGTGTITIDKDMNRRRTTTLPLIELPDNVGVHPEAAAILAQVKAAHVPLWSSLTPAAGRRMYQQRANLFALEPTFVESVRNVTIDGPGGPLDLRVYHPAPAERRPILVYLHGGGWTLGDLESHDEVCRKFAATAGCVVIGVDYRLAPEHPFPAALDDSEAALEWVLANATDFGGDPHRVAVGGDSAGGNLSAGLCLRRRDTARAPVQLQILIYPALRARFDTLSYFENATDKLLTRVDCRWFWDNFLGDTPPTDIYACPGEADDLAGLPRAVVITAEADPLRDEGEVYAHRLVAAGVPTAARRYAGMIHGFIGLPADLAAGRQALQLCAEQLADTWRT